MDKLRSLVGYLKFLNPTHILALALMLKALVADVSYATFLLTIPVLAFEGYKLYLKSKTPDPIRLSNEVQQELNAMKAKLSAMSMEKSVKPAAGQRPFWP
jgi:hypothetical protein